MKYLHGKKGSLRVYLFTHALDHIRSSRHLGNTDPLGKVNEITRALPAFGKGSIFRQEKNHFRTQTKKALDQAVS